MHVPQIRGAITRDLITKYHYFHTSFQIWPDQIKVGGEGAGGGGGRREKLHHLQGHSFRGTRMQEGIGVIEASQKAVLQRNGSREEIHFLFQGRLQAVQLSRENMAWTRQAGQGGLHWEVLPEHGHVQLQGESDPACGQGSLLSSGRNVMKTAFKVLSLGFSWAASGSKSCVWINKGFNTEMYLRVLQAYTVCITRCHS